MSNLKKMIPLSEKIKIIKRYLETGETQINVKTEFEGYPIGRWELSIRNAAKRDKFSPEKLEQLKAIGVLERGKLKTIDERIQQLIAWRKKHPKINVFQKDIPSEVLSEYANSQEEKERLVEEYKRIYASYEYIIQRRNIRKTNT